MASEPLTQIEQLIILADASAGSAEGRVRAREGLAASLGCSLEDIEEIVAERGKEEWEGILLNERVRRGMDSTLSRDVSWDRLEAAALRKLIRLVEADRVSGAGELLAMATKANSASRGTKRGGAPATANQYNLNYYAGNPDEGVLPSGHLGHMKMKVSHRIREQIEGAVEESSEGRVLDSIEMLALQDVQEAVSEDGGRDSESSSDTDGS